eukprot:6475521-Amphidinium_carterae.1
MASKSSPPPSLQPSQQRGQYQRQHLVKDGLFTHNRRGLEICRAFQEGSCGATVFGNKCPKDTSRVHQCVKCLSADHGSVDCGSKKEPTEAMPSQPPRFKKKGGGKGGRN